MTGSRAKDTPTDPFRPTATFRGSPPTPPATPRATRTDSRSTSLPDLNHEDWRKSEEYLYGIDLFNEGYWWECHEVLEGLWHASGVGTEAGHVLQAVIQCAAAHLKASTDRPVGAMRLHDHSVRHARWSGSPETRTGPGSHGPGHAGVHHGRRRRAGPVGFGVSWENKISVCPA